MQPSISGSYLGIEIGTSLAANMSMGVGLLSGTNSGITTVTNNGINQVLALPVRGPRL